MYLNYEKGLSKLTKDIYLKKYHRLHGDGNIPYEDKNGFSGWKAIQKCYADVKKKITLQMENV